MELELQKIGSINISKTNALITIILLILFFFGTITASADDYETTIVGVDPSSQTVPAEEIFTIDIYCIPGQPMKYNSICSNNN